MQKRKENKSVKIKSQFIIGSLFVLCGICTFSIKYVQNYFLKEQENDEIAIFFQEQTVLEKIVSDDEVIDNNQKQEIKIKAKESYIAVIEISKINLQRGLYSKDSQNNNINKNIEILKESDYPDITSGNFILVGHSGTARVSYFKNLYKLEMGDEINIYYEKQKYKYKIYNIYEIDKNGSADIVRNAEKNTLTLITCKDNSNKQIVIISELIAKEEM